MSAQPAADIAKAGYIIAVVQHPLGKGQKADVQGSLRPQNDELVAANLCLQRNAKFLPVRQQLLYATRIDDSAGQNVRTDL